VLQLETRLSSSLLCGMRFSQSGHKVAAAADCLLVQHTVHNAHIPVKSRQRRQIQQSAVQLPVRLKTNPECALDAKYLKPFNGNGQVSSS